METRRVILEKQDPYVGVTHQVLKNFRSRETWVSIGGGGNFFDPTEEEKRILEKYGSPVIVYPSGRIEIPK